MSPLKLPYETHPRTPTVYVTTAWLPAAYMWYDLTLHSHTLTALGQSEDTSVSGGGSNNENFVDE